VPPDEVNLTPLPDASLLTELLATGYFDGSQGRFSFL